MGLLSLIGLGNGRIKDAFRRRAVVIDVRTAHEYDSGKVPGSLNIPVDRIAVNVERIRAMNKPVILVCTSGARSGSVAKILREKGIRDVVNGGSWEKVVRILQNMQG